MDITPLLQAISSEQPGGSNIDDFIEQKKAYETFSNLKQRFAEDIVANVPQLARWQETQQQAIELAGTCKHIYLANIITQCGLKTEGLEGFRDGFRLIHAWTHEFWDHLYPRDVRNTLLQEISQPRFSVRLRRAELCRAGGLSYSYEDYEKALDAEKSPEADTANDARLTLAAFREMPREQYQRILDAVDETLKAIASVTDTFYTKNRQQLVNFSHLRETLEGMQPVLRTLTGVPVSETSAPAPTGQATAAPTAKAGPSISGPITTRKQAGEQIEAIARFFEQSEPSSPVPDLLRRAKRCIGKNFMELIDELASNKDHATQVLRSPPTNPE